MESELTFFTVEISGLTPICYVLSLSFFNFLQCEIFVTGIEYRHAPKRLACDSTGRSKSLGSDVCNQGFRFVGAGDFSNTFQI